MPADVRLTFLDGPPDPEVLCWGNKAVGEPPLLLGPSVWAAMKQALASAAPGRRVALELSATGEEILRRLTEMSDGEGSGVDEEHHLDDADEVRPPVAPVPSTAVV